MAFHAAEVDEVGFAFCGKSLINLERLYDGNGLIRSREKGGGNGLSFETGAFHFELEIGVPSGLEISKLDGIPSLFEICGAREFFNSATIAGSFVEDFLFVEEEGAAVHLEVEGIGAGGVDSEKSVEADGGVLRNFAIPSLERGEREVVGLSGLFRFDVAFESLPDFAAPCGVGEVSGNAGVF